MDLLRASAILLVVFGHGESILSAEFDLIHDILGYDGVTLFFVLSGFLIGGILIREAEETHGTLNLKKFWIRRWFRTLPNYFLILILLMALEYNLGNGINNIFQYFLFSQNLYTPHPTFFAEAWSISVEEWFYFTFPLIFYGLLKIKLKSKKAVFLAIVAVIVLGITFRFIKYLIIEPTTMGEWDVHFRKQVLTRLDSVAWGVLGAYLSYYYKDKWLRNKEIFLIVGLSIFIIVKFAYGFHWIDLSGLLYVVFRFTFDSLGTFLILPFLSDFKQGKGLFAKVITFISLISYSMYLLHLSIVRNWIIEKFYWSMVIFGYDFGEILSYLVYWFLTFLFSYWLFKYYESPTTSLRQYRWFQKQNLPMGNFKINITPIKSIITVMRRSDKENKF